MREFWSSDSPELLEFWSGGSGATDGRSGVTGYSEWLDVATPPPPLPAPGRSKRGGTESRTYVWGYARFNLDWRGGGLRGGYR